MLKLSDLAQRVDFRLGPLSISPSRRTVAGPAGDAHVEPLIMQAFLVLVDARGAVVTRTELFDRLWGGVVVGDDSLNRAIGKVRQIASQACPNSFEIDTIPRTGYRLIGEILAFEPELAPSQPENAAGASLLSRRALVGAGAAAAIGSAGWLWLGRERSDPRVEKLLDDGRRILRDGWPDEQAQGVQTFRKAVELDPKNAEAWGLLALALRNVAELAPPDKTSAVVAECEVAARRSLDSDPNDGNALTALVTVRPEFGNWGETEDGLRQVLGVAPDNPAALLYLGLILQSVGRARESWDLNERSAALEPLSPIPQYRRALKHWIFGRVNDADLTIDRALQLWPRHPAVWNARMYIFAYTGRPEAALTMLDDERTRPTTSTEAGDDLWRVTLRALSTRSSEDVAAATKANIESSAKSPGFAVRAIMSLSALGQLDATFGVAEGFLLRRGPFIGTLWKSKDEMAVNDHHWRRTMNLFTPATAAMRGHPRFLDLARGIGLIDYWRERRTGPDAMFRLG